MHFGPDEPDNQFFVPLTSPRSPPYKKRFGRVLPSNSPVPPKLALRSPGKRRKATTAQPLVSHTSSSYYFRRAKRPVCSSFRIVLALVLVLVLENGAQARLRRPDRKWRSTEKEHLKRLGHFLSFGRYSIEHEDEHEHEDERPRLSPFPSRSFA